MNRFTFFEDIQGGFIEKTFPGTINTATGLQHGLGYIPNGYIVVSQDKAGSIYKDGPSWTKEFIYLASDVPSPTVRIFVF